MLTRHITKISLVCTLSSFTALGSAQCILEGFTDEEAIESTLFGSSVDIQGDRMVVGAMLDTGADWASGAVHLFERQDDSWELIKIILAPDGDLTDMLGNSVAIDGDRIIAGAWWDEDTGTRSGAAYIFERDEETDWHMAAKLVASDGLPEATFGRTVAIQGDFAVVGAPLHSGDGSAAGSAYLYERDSMGEWSQRGKIVPSDLAIADRFGLAMDMDGTTVVIGSPWSDAERGKVYLFEIGAGGSWSETAILQPAGIDPGDQFGFDVALDGETLAVGAYKDDGVVEDSGSLWFYESSSLGWELSQGPLRAPELSSDGGAQFGVSVALEDDMALIGARYASIDSVTGCGTVVLANRTSAGWSLGEQLVSESPQTEGEFGWQVALDGSYGVVSALYEDAGVADDGRAYVLGLDAVTCGGVIGDLNGDGVVSGPDLTILLANWGPCVDVSDCPADLDGNGTVNGADLTLLLSNWVSL